jgi:serine/threonine-protein kinase
VAIPDVSKGSFDQAKATLEVLGFTVTRGDDQFSDTIPSDQVIGTNPDIGKTVPYGSSVEVVVSKGPDLIMVPSFIGDFLGTALAQLDALGFQVDLKGPQQLSKRVQDQTPAGAPAPRGSTVSLGT